MSPRPLFVHGPERLAFSLFPVRHASWTIAWIWLVAICFVMWCWNRFVPKDGDE